MSEEARTGSPRRASFVLLLAKRGVVLACLAGAVAVGLFVSPRRAQLRAAQQLRENWPAEDPTYCKTAEAHVEAKLQDEELDEVSGVIASRRQPGLLWIHNDSGDDARIFAIDHAGKLRARVRLAGVDARDFEDIALIAQPGRASDALVIADTGDNLRRRDTVQLLRVEEPHVPSMGAPVELVRSVHRLELQYEDGAHDVETLFADAAGDLYLVEKAHLLLREEPVGVYHVPASAWGSPRVVARKIATLPLGPATGGDISADGRMIALRNYWHVFWWPIGVGESLQTALTKLPCLLRTGDSSKQGESLAFLPDGTGFLTTTEGEHAELRVHLFASGN